jgi:hypothetical protein
MKMAIAFQRVVPAFRAFSLEKARKFYIDILGGKVNREHWFELAGNAMLAI